MRRVFMSVRAPAAIVLAMALAACGRSDPKLPVAPSSAASTAAPGGAVVGATISGTVVSGSTALSLLRPSGVALSVSIVGTSIGATIDASGRFTLQHVPPGNVTLAFSGTGVDARVTLTGVNINDRIQITVHVNGTTADLDENEHETADDRLEVEGKIMSINLVTRTLVVGEHQTAVSVPPGTPIHHGGTPVDFAKLVIGERVHIDATKSGTTFVARDVEVQNEHVDLPGPGDDHGHDGDNAAEVKGTVSGAAAGHACPAFTFIVGTTTVTTTATTKFEDTTCAGVVNGIKV
jgi:hypothetical protein